MPKFKVTAKCLSLASGEIIKSEIIEATNREDAETGFTQRYMTIEIISVIEETGDEFLDYLLKVEHGLEHTYKNLVDSMCENNAYFESVKDQKFLINTIVMKYRSSKEVK